MEVYCYYYILCTNNPFTTKLSLMLHHDQPECVVRKTGLLFSVSRSLQRFETSVNVCQSYMLSTIAVLATELDVLMD